MPDTAARHILGVGADSWPSPCRGPDHGAAAGPLAIVQRSILRRHLQDEWLSRDCCQVWRKVFLPGICVQVMYGSLSLPFLPRFFDVCTAMSNSFMIVPQTMMTDGLVAHVSCPACLYQLAPRAPIFRRDADAPQTLEGLQHFMRLNRWNVTQVWLFVSSMCHANNMSVCRHGLLNACRSMF